MLMQSISELSSAASVIIAQAASLARAFILRMLWFYRKMAFALTEIPLNVVLATIVVVLGLLAAIIKPILPLFMLGTIAFFFPLDGRAKTKFVMTGALSTAMGAFTIVDLPLSQIASMRLEGSPFTTASLATLDPNTIFVIATIGILILGLKIDLTPVQRNVLSVLINLHGQNRQAVKGEEIAELMDRAPGTIRNQMQSLKALNLVEAVTGPKGGYKAMATAYDVLRLDKKENGDEVEVAVIRNGVLVKGATASEIIFYNVMHSHHCGAAIRIIGNIRDFDIGDEVEVGPTPVDKLYIRGKVVELDNTMSKFILSITGMISIPRLPINKIARRAVRISPKASLREASRILVNNGVNEAFVEGGSPGLITLTDITKAVAEGRTDLEVREIMTNSFLTINSEELIFDAIKMLGKTGASQLVVLYNDVLWGFITPRNLIRSLVID
jgi:predicted transcriptional regulator